MQIVALNLGDVFAIAIATAGGAAVSLERQWSGHASGPQARFAGVRTFTMLGALAGMSGWLWARGPTLLASILLAGAAALVVAAYLAASSTDVDGTTEVAALVVLATGVLAGMGYTRLASGAIALTTLLLVEKPRIHALVERLDDTAFRAALRFAVMAVVILPLLPPGPFGPWGGVRPRELWILVLFFSALGFAGYVAHRVVGARHGYPLAGLLGGLISSTQVTLSFARKSREEAALGGPLAVGVIAACTLMFIRVLFATAVLAPALAFSVAPYVVAPFLLGLLALVVTWRRPVAHQGTPAIPQNPLQFKSALQMAALFQLVLFLVHFTRALWGSAGVMFAGAFLGLTDVDALTVSMSRSAEGNTEVAAQALAIGMLSNTSLKLVLAAVLGRGRFRLLATMALTGMAAAAAISLAVLR
jgi:uncharacterized membrane protein (DUF4010 family)